MDYIEQLDVNLLDGYLESLGVEIVEQMLVYTRTAYCFKYTITPMG